MIYRFALVGATGSGKSSVMAALERRHCHDAGISFIREAATEMLETGKISPKKDPVCFQQGVIIRQLLWEEKGLRRLREEGLPVQIQIADRGTADLFVYLDEEEKQRYFPDVELTSLLERYDAVFLFEKYDSLSSPDEGNPCRFEEEEERQLLYDRSVEVWGSHPNCFRIPCFRSVEDKIEYVIKLIQELTRNTVCL